MWFNFDDCFLNLDNIAMLNFLPDNIIEMFINGCKDKVTVSVRDGKEFFKQFGKVLELKNELEIQAGLVEEVEE